MADEIIMFRAPIEVTVNDETGEVTRVRVIDTEVEPDPETSTAKAELALGSDWPEWEIG